MDPERQTPLQASPPNVDGSEAVATNEPASPEKDNRPHRGLHRIFIGPHGLRAGWSVLVFLIVGVLVGMFVGGIFFRLHLISAKGPFSATSAIFQVLTMLLGLMAGAAVVARIEKRNILDFNLRGPRRIHYFFTGLVAGFLALSLLVGALWLGGWLHFGPVALSGVAIFRYGALWGCAFLLTGCNEEGTFRCYLLATLTRGLNFWWALGTVAVMCVFVGASGKGSVVWGVFVIALLGLVPCLWLHLKRVPESGFWQAAWVTSTVFGLSHTSNPGEDWVGIFAAAAVGFVFCVSVRVTGSAWWAIGCHAGWDWGETFFYGTADSGLVPKGHFLTTSSTGNTLWSGGSVGPEGSVLVLGVILLLLLLLLVLYGRRNQRAPAARGRTAGGELRKSEWL